MDRIVQKYLKKIKPVRKQIREMWLFGSRARGDHSPGSDYDFLIVVDKRDRKILDVIHGAAADLLLDELADVSPKVYAEEAFRRLLKMNTPFTRNVRKEGVRLA